MQRGGPEAKVLLHVYDWGTSGITRLLNSYVQRMGIFHTGVEVYGSEWCFGACEESSRCSGVSRMLPRSHSQHTFRVTVPLGGTKLSLAQVGKIMEVLKERWAGDTYNVLHHNCNHFSDALCSLLGCSPVPAWAFGILQPTTEAPESCNHEDTEETADHPVVFGERASLLPQDMTRAIAICGCLPSSPQRAFHMDKENVQISPLGAISSSIPASPETHAKKYARTPPITQARAAGASSNEFGVVKLNFDASCLSCNKIELPLDRPSSLTDDSLWWQEVTLDGEDEFADECFLRTAKSRLGAEKSGSSPQRKCHVRDQLLFREPTQESAWHEAIAADAAVGALPPGGLPWGWSPMKGHHQVFSDGPGMACPDRAVTSDAIWIEDATSKCGRQPLGDEGSRTAMLRELRNQAGDCVLLRWEEVLTLDS